MLVGNDDKNNTPENEDYNYDSDIDSGDYEEQINTVDIDNIDDEIEVQEDASALASTPGKNIILIGAVLIGLLYFVYNFVFKKTPEEIAIENTKKIIQSQPVGKAGEHVKPNEDITLAITSPVAPDLPEEFGDVASPVPLEDELESLGRDSSFESGGSIFPDTLPPFQMGGGDDSTTFRPGEYESGGEVAIPQVDPGMVLPPIVPLATPQVGQIPIPQVQQPIVVPTVPNPVPGSAGPTIPAPPQVAMGPTAEELAAKKAQKRRQSMVMMGGGGSPAQINNSVMNNEIITGDFEMEISNADKAKPGLIGNLNNMIAQGKMIDVVLETAINTDLDGPARAIVSRDVYAESGRSVLIPKGSRLIGQYSAPEEGNSRVIIAWGRVIRPDGIDIMIDSPGTDKMGRSGIVGFTDHKFFDIISNALMLSALTIGTSILVDDINDAQQQTSTSTTGSDGSTTTTNTGTSTDAAVLATVSDMSDIASDITEGYLNDQPTTIVQQGTRMKVFINKDLIFPNSIASSVTFIK